MSKVANILTFPQPDAKQWADDWGETIRGLSPRTQDVYLRSVRQFVAWCGRMGGGQFDPSVISRAYVEMYLESLQKEGYSVPHRARSKIVIGQFCRWLIEEKRFLLRDPTRGIAVVAESALAPRRLSDEQRIALRNLVARVADLRGQAIFALGYWAGCRVSDVSYLLMEDTHVGPKVGWVRVGHKQHKFRDIDLHNEARRPLYAYLQGRGEGEYVFSSQRSERMGEEAIHSWLRTIKLKARVSEWEQVADITFHDLRHDFAHRAREAGWDLEDIAYYLGHITSKGTPAIQTTARYTQVGREDVKKKLILLGGKGQ